MDSNIDASADSVEELEPVVARIRQRWPAVKILVRGDGGFCREKLMAWCEREGMDYVFGLAQNERLKKLIEAQIAQAAQQYAETKLPARVFSEFLYSTKDTWSRERRVIAKAEQLEKGSNPRFVVTSLSQEQMAAQELYEKVFARARRVSGESHQGATVGSVCGSHQHGQDVVESTAGVLLFDHLCSAADAAADGACGYRVGESAMRNHPAEAA